MSRIFIRITIEELDLDNLVGLKAALDELLADLDGVEVEITILPSRE